MSALRKSRAPGSTRTMRLRKVWCQDCGYTVRMARSWIAIAVPACPNPDCGSHGQAMMCENPADAIEAGIMEVGDLGRERTRVCRENGWQDEIVRRSPGRRSKPRQCKHIGCSRFVKLGELHCGEHAGDGMPF